MASATKKKPKTEIEPSEQMDRGAELRAEIVRISEQHDGRVSPEAVVEAASDPDNFLHDLFTWDDGQAAHRYRCMQAAALIRRVKIYVVRMSSETKTIEVRPVRALQSAPTDRKKGGSGSYSPIERLAQDDTRREALVADCGAQLQGIRNRFRELSEFGTVWTAIDAAVA